MALPPGLEGATQWNDVGAFPERTKEVASLGTAHVVASTGRQSRASSTPSPSKSDARAPAEANPTQRTDREIASTGRLTMVFPPNEGRKYNAAIDWLHDRP